MTDAMASMQEVMRDEGFAVFRQTLIVYTVSTIIIYNQPARRNNEVRLAVSISEACMRVTFASPSPCTSTLFETVLHCRMLMTVR
jgi:hypothetical protein